MTIYLIKEGLELEGSPYEGPIPPPPRYLPWLRRIDGDLASLCTAASYLLFYAHNDCFACRAASTIHRAAIDLITLQESPTERN